MSAGAGRDWDRYAVCDRLLDPETNQHCEFDGNVTVNPDGSWPCPFCGAKRWGGVE